MFSPLAGYDRKQATEIYRDKLKQRINYFISNPKFCAKFYARKEISMYTENTYQAGWYNQTYNFIFSLFQENDDEYKNHIDENKDEVVDNFSYYLLFYQKGLVILIFTLALFVLVQKRKNLSKEVCLLLTIFIGGFLFHTIWEAKSRYIIPYIIVLIPVASIYIDNIKLKIKGK